MHKIGILMMGKMGVASPKKVKEIILEVEGKTKMMNIAEYLLEMNKISDLNVEFSLQKNGRPVSQQSNITQTIRHTKLVNGVIKLYLYEKGEYLNVTVDHLKAERQKNEPKELPEVKKPQEVLIKEVQEQPKKGFCCC